MSCGRRLPGHCRSRAPSRRVVGCMTSSRLFSPPRRRPCSRPPRPQLSRSRHANFWPGTKGSAPAARGGRARLSHAARPAHTPLAGSARVAGGSPPPSSPATAAAPPGQPPWKPGSARRRLLGRRTGAGPIGSPAGRGGGGGKDWRPRRRGRGFPGLGRGTPAHPAPPLAHSLLTHGSNSVPACEGERRGAVLVMPGKSPDKGKPRPHNAGPAPPPPLLSNRRDGSPAQGRTQKGRPRRPHYQPVVARATRGPHLPVETYGLGWAVCTILGSSFAANDYPCIFPMSPLALTKEQASLKHSLFLACQGIKLDSGTKLLDKL